jgi:hypothetical protein
MQGYEKVLSIQRIAGSYHNLHQPARKMACQPARTALKIRIASAIQIKPTAWRRRSVRSAGEIIAG